MPWLIYAVLTACIGVLGSCKFYLTVSIILLYNILYVFILLLHTYFILFIYFLADISTSFAILNSRQNKGSLLLLLWWWWC